MTCDGAEAKPKLKSTAPPPYFNGVATIFFNLLDRQRREAKYANSTSGAKCCFTVIFATRFTPVIIADQCP
jgi:hypothetical protein